jgi:hypothetical protein
MRSHIRGIIVRYGVPGFCITIKHSGLQNPLVVVEYSGDIFAAANAAIRRAESSCCRPLLSKWVFLAIFRIILESENQ